MYYSGTGTVQSFEDALAWFEMAGAQAHPGAAFNAGAMHLNGEGVAASERKAVEWFRKAALAGNDDGVAVLVKLGAEPVSFDFGNEEAETAYENGDYKTAFNS